ncbi:MAG: hypothetical protein AAFO77_07660 [Pseudomonadota bacterium]
MSITARIEKNRLALLAVLAPWFVFAFWHCGRGQKPLPPRVAAYALSVIAKIERAAGFLLIASVYAAMPNARHVFVRCTALRGWAACLASLGVRGTRGTQSTRGSVTIAALYRRLATVWRLLSNLRTVAMRLARQMVWKMMIASQAAARTVTIIAQATPPHARRAPVEPP